MKFEIIESTGEWIVRHRNVEVARFNEQDSALHEVSRRLAAAKVGDSGASLAVRFQPRSSAA